MSRLGHDSWHHVASKISLAKGCGYAFQTLLKLMDCRVFCWKFFASFPCCLQGGSYKEVVVFTTVVAKLARTCLIYYEGYVVGFVPCVGPAVFSQLLSLVLWYDDCYVGAMVLDSGCQSCNSLCKVVGIHRWYLQDC